MSGIAQSAPASLQFLDRVAPGRDADHFDPGAVAGPDVARGVAYGDRRWRGRAGAAGDAAAALERLLGQLGAVAGVGAVAAEGEEAVEVAAGELDVGGGLDVAGDDAEQDPRCSTSRGSSSSIPGITR